MRNVRRFFYNATVGIVLTISIILASVNFASANTNFETYYDDMDGSFNNTPVSYQNLSNVFNGDSSIGELFLSVPDKNVLYLDNASGKGIVSYDLSNVDEVNQVSVGFYTTQALTGYFHRNTHEMGLPSVEDAQSFHLYKHNGNLLIDCGYCINLNDNYFREAVYSDNKYTFNNSHYVQARPGDSGVTRIGLSALVTLKDGDTMLIPVNATFSGTNPTNGNDIVSVSEFSNSQLPGYPFFYYEASLDLSSYKDIKDLSLILEGYEYLNPISLPLPSLFGFANVSMTVSEKEETSSSEETTSSSSSSGSSEGSSSSSSSEGSNSSSSSSSESSSSSSSSLSSSSFSSESSSSSSSSTSSRPSISSESSYITPTVPGVQSESSTSESESKSSSAKENNSSSRSQKEKINSTKSQPDNIKDEKSEKDDSRLVVDANNQEKSNIDNTTDSNSDVITNIIEKEESSHETTPFIPSVPKSLAISDEPSIEKVIGSSAVVTIAAVVYVIFYKKMLALL